jgi:hypothetical protein
MDNGQQANGRDPGSRLAPQLRRRGIRKLALVGAARESGRAFQADLRRAGVDCELVDGLQHQSARRARQIAGSVDLVVVCVSGLIAHRVSEPYRALGRGGGVVSVRARGAAGIGREIEAWLMAAPLRAA